MVVLAFSCVDSVFITLCVYIAAQFNIIHEEILNLNNHLNFKKCTKTECDVLRKQISRIIQRHADTINMSNDVSELFILVVVVHFLTAALSIGLIVTNLTMFATPPEIVLYSFYILVDLTQLYIYCYGGTFIMESV